jgi:hypothetical protein
MKTAKSLRDWAREYLRHWGVRDDAGADQEHELIRVLRAAITADRAARDTEHAAQPTPGEREAGRRGLTADEVEHLIQFWIRNTTPVRVPGYRMKEDAVDKIIAIGIRGAVMAVVERMSRCPAPGDMVRREDVVRWLTRKGDRWFREALTKEGTSYATSCVQNGSLLHKVASMLDDGSWLGDLARLDAGKEDG